MTSPSCVFVATGACFWTLEAVFQQVVGVLDTTPVHARLGSGVPLVYDPSQDLMRCEALKGRFNPQAVSPETLARVLLEATSPGLESWEGPLSELFGLRVAMFFGCPKHAAQATKELARYRATAAEGCHAQILDWLPDTTPAPSVDCNYFQRRPGESYSRSIIAPKLDRLADRFGSEVFAPLGPPSSNPPATRV